MAVCPVARHPAAITPFAAAAIRRPGKHHFGDLKAAQLQGGLVDVSRRPPCPPARPGAFDRGELQLSTPGCAPAWAPVSRDSPDIAR